MVLASDSARCVMDDIGRVSRSRLPLAMRAFTTLGTRANMRAASLYCQVSTPKTHHSSS
jgi:hypothetical protein